MTRPLRTPPALAGAPSVRTDDPRRLAGELGTLLGEGTVAVHDNRASLDGALFTRSFDTISLGYLDIGTPTTIDIPVTADAVTVCMNQGGALAARVDGVTVHTTTVQAIVLSPRTAVRLEMTPESPQLLVRLERHAVEAAVARTLGRRVSEPLRFEPLFDLSSPESIRWSIAVQLLSTESMTDSSLLSLPLGRQSIADLLVASLLLLQPSNYSSSLRRQATSGLMVDALAYIEQHLAEPFSLAALAHAVHVSPRHLQQTFRDRLGTTPSGYVRDQRLQRVRIDLTDADPRRGATVAGIAQRWGFAHAGRFANEYRDRFGESPSRTLRGV
ncbi:AraC family transcriptional regulator [Microbacterium sp. F2]|uniref:AraC family transcriptional regulator n=1 Tax=Microbacterium sp. F2 TaxID=3422228 RepID=UPI003FCF1436